jgi:glycosyltransferase involved in cell wall biosynthesis
LTPPAAPFSPSAARAGGEGSRRLLWLAYFFPPLGGGGCQRTLKLVRYLEPLGWSSTVVTVRDPDYWILDPSLAEEIPARTEVIRVRALTAQRLLALTRGVGIGGGRVEESQGARRGGVFRALRRAQSWVLIPDGYVGWARAGTRAAARRIRAGGIDALWTTSSPESAHVAGLSLKRRFRLPWVADFRDPWVGRVTYAPPSRWHDNRHRALEAAVVRAADRITVVSDAMADLYRERYPDLPPERIVVLENGVDPDDWRRADAGRFPSTAEDAARDRGRFVLLHAGQLAHRPTARTLLEAARRVIAADPALAGSLRIRFLGGNEEIAAGDPLLRALGDVVALDPSRPHLEALAAMRRADALALLGHGGRADAFLYTGKIYEYLTSGRPILAILDAGPAASLLRESGHRGVFASAEVEGVAAWLGHALGSWRAGSYHPDIPDALQSAWDRQFLAARAAEMLSRIVDA